MSTGSTLLLVEDDPDIRGVLAEMLADEGYTVIEAGDGLAAIDLLHQHLPPPASLCLVILDMMLPEAGGLDVLRELATLGNYTPVLAMSADHQQLLRARDAGADDTLPKPFDLEQLTAVVERNCTGETRVIRGSCVGGVEECHRE